MLDRTKVVLVTEAGNELLWKLCSEKRQRIRQLSRNAEPFEARSVGKISGHVMTDPLSEELERLQTEMEELHLKIRSAIVVPPTSQRKVVEIGNGITLLYTCRIAHKPRAVRKNFIVSGHGETDCKATPPRIAYDAPLIKPFIGASKGYVEHVRIDGAVRPTHLTNIYIPK